MDNQGILNDFENAEFTEHGDVTTFIGTKKLDKSLFEKLDNINHDEIALNEGNEVKYRFTYNKESNIVTLTATLMDKNGIVEIETIKGTAFINLKGEIDALMEIDDECILLSEMQDAGLIENCGWFKRLVKSIVKVATVTGIAIAVTATVVGTAGTGALAVIGIVGGVACTVSTTQTIKANTNYNHNKKQTMPSYGIKDGYIVNQDAFTNWKFGFTYMNEVGCEVIAVYNALIALGKTKLLADIIYDFEMLNIDYDIGFGYLGSNPRQIYRALEKYNVNYKKYSNFNALKKEATNKKDCLIIFTTKNNHAVVGIHSIHTFLIKKTENNLFYSYNGYIDIGDGGPTSLENAIQYSYDYGYIIY